jgi:fluoride exporter
MTLLLVTVGALLGAPTRWAVDQYVQRRWTPAFPWGTLTVNVAGSLLLGALVARWSDDGAAAALIGIGFCGSLTTFSSFAWESHRLAEDGAWLMSAANVLGSVALCLAAASLGWWAGS